jgi:ABC-2 type transport system permease protein
MIAKYLAFLKISLKKSLVYRFRSFIWFFFEVGPALMMLFFWSVVFQSKSQIAGFDLYAMVIYYLVIMFSRSLILSHPEETLEEEIYTGQINAYLSRPANLIDLKFFYEIAYKFLRFLYLIPLLGACYFFFFKNQDLNFSFKIENLLFFLLSCSLSFYLFFLMKFLIGLTAFWFTEISWLISLEEITFWFFGGLLLPLDLLPQSMQFLANFLPFKYIYYLPSLGLLGKLTIKQMFFSFFIQSLWLVLFLLLVKKIYQAGLKIYSAFGD